MLLHGIYDGSMSMSLCLMKGAPMKISQARRPLKGHCEVKLLSNSQHHLGKSIGIKILLNHQR